MEKQVQIVFDKLEYSDGKLVIEDQDLLQSLQSDAAGTVRELSARLSQLSLDHITITESGQVVVDNPAFLDAVKRSILNSLPRDLGGFVYPPYVNNYSCSLVLFNDLAAHAMVQNYWCNNIVEEMGTNYICV